MLQALARLTRHGGQTRITHPHAEAPWVEQACREIAAFQHMRAPYFYPTAGGAR